jgi:hypothetical protein
MIANSKEVKEWNLSINLEPDYIEGKILKKPSILIDVKTGTTVVTKTKSLDDNKILTSIVHQPINFNKWAIFCLEKDVENAKYLQDKFYSLSEANALNIFVDFGDIISLHNKSNIEDFKDAINSYFKEYV